MASSSAVVMITWPLSPSPPPPIPQVDAVGGERFGEHRHRAGLVVELDHELIGHPILLAGAARVGSIVPGGHTIAA